MPPCRSPIQRTVHSLVLQQYTILPRAARCIACHDGRRTGLGMWSWAGSAPSGGGPIPCVICAEANELGQRSEPPRRGRCFRCYFCRTDPTDSAPFLFLCKISENFSCKKLVDFLVPRNRLCDSCPGIVLNVVFTPMTEKNSASRFDLGNQIAPLHANSNSSTFLIPGRCPWEKVS